MQNIKYYESVSFSNGLGIALALPYQIDKTAIMMSKVNMRLLQSLDDEIKRNQWFPSIKYKDKPIAIGDHNYIIDFGPGMFQNHDALTMAVKDGDNFTLVSDLPDFKGARFPLIRLYAIQESFSGFDRDFQAARKLAFEMDIKENEPFSGNNFSGDGWFSSFTEKILPQPNSTRFQFLNADNTVALNMDVYPMNGAYYMAPLTLWGKKNEFIPQAMYIFPDRKFPLYNFPRISGPEKTFPIVITPDILLANKHRSAIDSVWTTWVGGVDGIDQTNWDGLENRKILYLLYYDNDLAILSPKVFESIFDYKYFAPVQVFPYAAHLENTRAHARFVFRPDVKIENAEEIMLPLGGIFSTIKNKKELFYDRSRAHEELHTGFKVYQKLVDKYGENLDFNFIDAETIMGNERVFKLYNRFNFMDLCQKFCYNKPIFVRDYKNELKSEILIKEATPVNHLISPIISDKTLAVFYAPSGLGKTWLSLSIGIAVSRGLEVFKGWDSVKENNNVLYLAGEMDEKEIENRIAIVRNAYGQGQCQTSDTFHYSITHSDLNSHKGRNELKCNLEYFRSRRQHIKLLILDNLNTLIRNGEYKSSWDSFLDWLTRLQSDFSPLACLIVHHSNKANTVLGTSAIRNRVDLLIRADFHDPLEDEINEIVEKAKKKQDVPAGIQIQKLLERHFHENIEMFISYDKTRFLPRHKARPFKVTFNPEQPEKGWHVSYPAYLNGLDSTKIPDEKADGEKEAIPPVIQQNENVVVSQSSQNEQLATLSECIGFSWKEMNDNQRAFCAQYFNTVRKMSARCIAEHFGVSLRNVQMSLAFAKKKLP